MQARSTEKTCSSSSLPPIPAGDWSIRFQNIFTSRLQFFEMPTFRLLAFFSGLEREGVVTIEAAMGRTLVAVAALLVVLLPRDAAAQSTKYTKGDPVPLYANKVPQSAVLARSWWAADAQSTRAFAKSGRALCESE